MSAPVSPRPETMVETPGDALRLLREGNERFAGGKPRRRDDLERARRTATAQKPHSAIVACIDSRVTPEIVLDQGIGDLFCCRAAGNGVSDDVLGGLEFSAKIMGVKLIVVMGHTNCGAMMGACDGVRLGHLTGALAHLLPAVESVTGCGPRDSGNRAYLDAATRANVRLGAERITRESPVLAELVSAGTLGVVGAHHDLATGRVEFAESAL